MMKKLGFILVAVMCFAQGFGAVSALTGAVPPLAIPQAQALVVPAFTNHGAGYTITERNIRIKRMNWVSTQLSGSAAVALNYAAFNGIIDTCNFPDINCAWDQLGVTSTIFASIASVAYIIP
jgi:hypothetical protein